MALKAVFFDLDGTLLDTSGDLGAALNHLRQQEYLPALTPEQIRPEVSNGANALVRLGFGEQLDVQANQRYRERLLEYYLENIAEYTVPFDGIERLLLQLTEHKVAWGIVTNKPSLYTEALMRHFPFASPPVATVSPDQVGVSKPDPEPLLEACRQAGVAVDECLYVGDHQRDVECAHRAGMQAVAVGYGFTNDPAEHRHWNAQYIADTADEIWPIVQDCIKAMKAAETDKF